MLKKIITNDLMLTLSVLAAIISLFITPPSIGLVKDIDYRTLLTLFMMLTILEGFKKENIFLPLIKFSNRLKSMVLLSLFLIMSVFFSSMFVTNDVSLIVFVPLTILLFKSARKEKYILPVISMENIAAVRGSLLMPFGSPQNLFIFSKSGMNALEFIKMMAPLCIISFFLLIVFVLFLYRKNLKEEALIDKKLVQNKWDSKRKKNRLIYIYLFVIVLTLIITRSSALPIFSLIVLFVVYLTDKDILKKTDYVLLLTFLCFFIFSSSIKRNEAIASFIGNMMNNKEYLFSIILSQFISNVPASIVLYPFAHNIKALLYGLDTAGLCSLIGSLASVINYRIYVKEYPQNGFKFIKVFTLISWAFFIIVVLPGYLWSL